MVCAGGPWPSCGTLRRHRPRGTISGLRAGPVARLASETRLRAQCKHRPLQRPDITAGPRFARLAAGPSWFVGEGFIPPAGVPAAAGSGGMRASRPTAARGRVPFPFGRAFAMVCRGGPWPSCGTLRRRGVCGTMRASSPTKVRYNRKAAFSPVGRGPAVVRRGGIYLSRGCSRRRGVRRDEGIPPYGRPGARALPVWPGVRHGL